MPLEVRPDDEGQLNDVVDSDAAEHNNGVPLCSFNRVSYRIIMADHVEDRRKILMEEAAWQNDELT